MQKASLIFNAIVGLVFVLGMWVMWSLVIQKGIPEKIVDLFDAVTIELTIDGPLYFRITTLLAGVGVIGMTAFMTLGAVIYNLISDLVGGVEVTVLEESYNVAQPQPTATRRTFSWKPTPAPRPGNGKPAPRPETAPDRERVTAG